MNSGAWPVLDLLETGYRRRGTGTNMASIETHLRLFDLMARAGRFVTATGVTDDHEGLVGSWSSRTNRFATGIWSPSLADGNVRDALLAGQAWCVEVQDGGTVDRLDIMADGIVPMGSISVQQRATREVQVTCPVVPSGGYAELVTGPVDYVSSDLTNRTTTILFATEAQLERGTVTGAVDTSSNCFVRVQIRNTGGEIVAFSNPIWLLRSAPPGGIPALRRAPDVPPTGSTTTSSSSSTSSTSSTTTSSTTTTTVPAGGGEPNSTVTAPTPNAVVGTSVAFAGNATGSPGVAAVRYGIRDQVTRLWLRTTGWGDFLLFDATVASPGAASTAWSFTRTLPPGSYGIDVRAVSTAGVTETTRPWVVFTVR
jgi:hypothetical protein